MSKKITKKITPFAKKVYEATKLIPKGKVTTYKLIAHAIGKPNSSRAVGRALSINPYAPIVPCHRVICSNRHIGGFFGSSDATKKLQLLKKEGVKFNNLILDKSEVLYIPTIIN